MMVTCLGGEWSVGLRVYSNCRSYYYLQFTLSMYSEGSVWVQSAMSVLLSLMFRALQWLVIKVIHTYSTNSSNVYGLWSVWVNKSVQCYDRYQGVHYRI